MTIHVYDPIGGPKCKERLPHDPTVRCERKRGHDLPAHVGVGDDGVEWAWGGYDD